MLYLALDQSLKTSGWAVFEDDILKDYGHFTIPAHKPIEFRLNSLMKELSNLENKFEFQDIFFEDIQSQQNKETYKKLAYVQAVILIWCYNTNHKFYILSPSHWRSILKEKYKINFGKSRADQKQTAKTLINQIFEINPTEDECDAICIGLAGLAEKNKKLSAF